MVIKRKIVWGSECDKKAKNSISIFSQFLALYHIFVVCNKINITSTPASFLDFHARELFELLLDHRALVLRRAICCLDPLECSLRMPNIEIRRFTLRLHFLCQMCTQNCRFWKENTKKDLPALRSVHLDEGLIYHLLRKACFSYECRPSFLSGKLWPFRYRDTVMKGITSIASEVAVQDLVEDSGLTSG